MLIYFMIVAGIVLAEEGIKRYLKKKYPDGRVLSENVHIELLENEGAAGGLLSGRKEFLKGICAVLLGVCAGELAREIMRKQNPTLAGIGLSLLLGGGLSNFLDRMRTGSVTDYLRFPNFPVKKIRNLVFNAADFCILLGVILQLFRKK